MTRSERRHRTQSIIRRRRRFATAHSPGQFDYRPEHVYAKRRPLGCWRAGCGLCTRSPEDLRSQRRREVYLKTGQMTTAR